MNVAILRKLQKMGRWVRFVSLLQELTFLGAIIKTETQSGSIKCIAKGYFVSRKHRSVVVFNVKMVDFKIMKLNIFRTANMKYGMSKKKEYIQMMKTFYLLIKYNFLIFQFQLIIAPLYSQQQHRIILFYFKTFKLISLIVNLIVC